MSMPKFEEKIGQASIDDPSDGVIPGSYDDDAVTRGLLVDAIRKCEKSREQIAERMSWLLARTVTASMLNDFTADSKQSHRFPFGWSRAFCESTGDWRLMHALADRSGFLLISKDDADVLTLGELVIQEQRARNEITRKAGDIIER